MGSDDVETATRFVNAVADAVRSGDREPVYALVASNVEWVVPERTFHGLDEVREHLIWGFPPEHLDVEFEIEDVADLGDGRVRLAVRQVYLWKETGAFEHDRHRRIDLAIRDGMVRRYEMRIVG